MRSGMGLTGAISPADWEDSSATGAYTGDTTGVNQQEGPSGKDVAILGSLVSFLSSH